MNQVEEKLLTLPCFLKSSLPSYNDMAPKMQTKIEMSFRILKDHSRISAYTA
jgi:hypothetical protein